MRAILPGRPQSTRQAVCTAEWDGLRLVAYISGDTAIIFDGKRTILQTIFVDDVESLHAITIDESSGRLALCDRKDVYLYEPLGRDEGDLRWAQMHKLRSKELSSITYLSWGSAEELLVSGSHMIIWNISEADKPEPIWVQELASPVAIACFAPDAGLIASCSQYDLIVKIWRRLSYEKDGTRFDISYLRHPSAVTDVHWRKPWHSEQNLDNLLYTFCSDNQIRAWTYSDPHAPSVMQKIATFDMNESIQPRRLSTSSISKRRYAFIFDSRDFSSATEKAIQACRGERDHALEHLIEIANRSPEICVILDGVGHMSVWGLENAGYKNKQAAEKFNVALVDGVDVQLPSEEKLAEEYIHFTSFAGGSHPSSVSLLVHSYSGHIDWYESPISEFFDTSSKPGRVELLSSWSGHDSTVERMIRGQSGNNLLSWTDEGGAIVWTQSSSGALIRSSQFQASGDVIDACLLEESKSVLVLYDDCLILWDIRSQNSVKIGHAELCSKIQSEPILLCRIHSNDTTQKAPFAVMFGGGQVELFSIFLPPKATSGQTNGFHQTISSCGLLESTDNAKGKRYVRCDEVHKMEHIVQAWHSNVVSVTAKGDFEAFDAQVDTKGLLSWRKVGSVATKIAKASLVEPLSNGKVVVVDATGKDLSIWDLSLGCCEYQTKIEDLGHVEKVQWNMTAYGNHGFAVCYAHHIKVFGQGRYTMHKTGAEWKFCQDIRLRDFTTHPIGDICWLKGSDLAVGAGNQILVFESTTSFSSNRDGHGRVKPLNLQIDQIIDISNTEMPIFHPDVLDRLMSGMQDSLVERIFRKLNEELKYYTEGDYFFSDLQMADSVSTITLPEDSYKHIHGQSAAEDAEYGSAENTLSEETSAHLDEGIAKLGQHQLTPEDKGRLSQILSTFLELRKHQKSLDENALIYLYSFMITHEDNALPWSAYVAATLSNSQEALLDIILRHYDSKITFPIARRAGIFLWLTESEALRVQLENVARAEYNKDQDDRTPIDCSLYYLALNKKQVLINLWRMTVGIKEKENTMKLLRNNFEEPRWKATALKNAYALLSKRRFEYAAAFFLLGGNLPDAVNVCVNQLEDFQLAVAIARVWNQNDDVRQNVLKNLIEKKLMRIAAESDEGKWMAAWGYCRLEKWPEAIKVVVLPAETIFDTEHLSEVDKIPRSMSFQANDPALVNLYLQLRDILVKNSKWTEVVITPAQEWAFIMRCVKFFIRAGMATLALRLVRNWNFIPWEQAPIIKEGEETVEPMSAHTDDGDRNTLGEEQQQEEKQKKPPPTQFVEPTADSLLDSFGF